MSKGILFVISAPSGTGKTTLLKMAMARIPGLAFSVSHTTRLPRPGEQNGLDYHFVTRAEFEAMVEDGQFLEWAKVHDNLYGTSTPAIQQQLADGQDLILDIDVQGAAIIRKNESLKGAAHIFISPPGLGALEQRLRGRNTDTEESVRLRLENAKMEMQYAKEYDYIMVNDKLDEAADLLASIILAERARAHRLPSGEPVEI